MVFYVVKGSANACRTPPASERCTGCLSPASGTLHRTCRDPVSCTVLMPDIGYSPSSAGDVGMGNGWALLFAVAVVSGAASAQTPDQERCQAPDPDLSIKGCTAVIQSGHETQQLLAIAFFYRGRAYARKSQFDRAIEDLDEAIRLNPNYAYAFNARGAAYGSKGQPDRAIEDLDEAIRLRPNDADAFYNRGSTYLRKGQLDRAIEDYDQAIRIRRNYADAFNNRGNAYLRKGQPDRAIEDYDQAIRIAPNHVSAFLNRALAKQTKGDFIGSDADLDKARQLNPNVGN
jgi:tetratricopeptide (TPR) repeat protein